MWNEFYQMFNIRHEIPCIKKYVVLAFDVGFKSVKMLKMVVAM